MIDKKQMAKAIYILTESTAIQLSVERIEAWRTVLNAMGITLAEFQESIVSYILNGKSFGTIQLSDILRSGNYKPKQIAEPDTTVKGRTQAHAILEHLHRYGANAMLPATIDATSRRLLNGRWSMRSLGENLIEAEEQWFVKEFIEAYKAESEMQQYHDNTQIEYDEQIRPILELIGKAV
jgi:hypothetical protein